MILLPVVLDDPGGAGDPVLAASESVKRIQLLFMPMHQLCSNSINMQC